MEQLLERRAGQAVARRLVRAGGLDHLAERGPGEVRHGEVEQVSLGAGGVDRHDVRVVEPGQGPPLAVEPDQQARAGRLLRRSVLIATRRSSGSSTASNTSPMPPRPIERTTRYGPNRSGWGRRRRRPCPEFLLHAAANSPFRSGHRFRELAQRLRQFGVSLRDTARGRPRDRRPRGGPARTARGESAASCRIRWLFVITAGLPRSVGHERA